VNRSNLPKPILTRSRGGALRYAWLRAPPSRRAKPDPNPSELLTHKSPYEGGQRRASAVPTIFHAVPVMVGTPPDASASGVFAHPTRSFQSTSMPVAFIAAMAGGLLRKASSASAISGCWAPTGRPLANIV